MAHDNRRATTAMALLGTALSVQVLFGGQTATAADVRASEAVVEAESRFGHGHITGSVRQTDLGPQVQLPGGRWVYCRRSCSETLRVETVDFFELNAAGSGQITNECGIFGCLDLGFSR